MQQTSRFGGPGAAQGSGGTAWHTPPAAQGWLRTLWRASWRPSALLNATCIRQRAVDKLNT